MAELLLYAFVLMAIWMTGLWMFAQRRGEADIVDAGWAAGIGIVACFYALFAHGDPLRRLMLALLVGVWSARLAWYILQRALEPGEDGRYATLRTSWGVNASAKFFLFFQMQGALVALLSIPFLAVVFSSKPFGSAFDYIAILLSSVSIIGESIADKQLAMFRADANNRGKVCERGLWAYSRHPNYFFEWFHWLSYVFLAVGSPLFIISPLSAILVLFLILKVTGIPPTEERAIQSRGDAYRDYQRRVSAFVPWFRRS
jgi:steroid 5-alpha reductase family enzyme